MKLSELREAYYEWRGLPNEETERKLNEVKLETLQTHTQEEVEEVLRCAEFRINEDQKRLSKLRI